MRKKSSFLPLTVAMALSSCSTGIAGTYKFQMGKSEGTKMSVSMELTNKDYMNRDSSKILGKEFNLEMEMSGLNGTATAEDESLGNAFKFTGFYNRGGTDLDGSAFPTSHLSLGTDIILESLETEFEVPSDLIEFIIYAELQGSTINVYIPVSQEDLQFQLYWYGYKVDLSTFTFEKLNYEYYTTKPTIGSHPTTEDIAKIKAHEANEGDDTNIFRDYRDYHVLTMGLSK